LIVSAIFLILSASAFAAQDYLIGVQDVLRITVFEYDDLRTETRVNGDGKITFPLLGEIEVKNLTTSQVEKVIAGKLAESNIVKDPQVQVFVQEYKGRKVTIIGEVMKPGQYEISGPTTILDLLSLSLGMSPNAGYMVTVFRKETDAKGKENTKKLSLDVDSLLNSGDLSQNIEIQSGDMVYVPKAVFYVYGEVNKPGAYRLEKGITVKRAISLAGGLTPRGSHYRITITRKEADQEKTKGADIDDTVQVEDIIRIKERIF
jgi:polysaccharide export outer membrane protein